MPAAFVLKVFRSATGARISYCGSGRPGNVQKGCSMRNLNDHGREQARMLGTQFRRLSIPVDDVLSIEFCRCWQTAELAFGGTVRFTALPASRAIRVVHNGVPNQPPCCANSWRRRHHRARIPSWYRTATISSTSSTSCWASKGRQQSIHRIVVAVLA